MSKETNYEADGITKLPVAAAPKHTSRYVVWSDEPGEGGRIFLLVGYCPDTLPYFLGLVADAQKTFPELNLKEVTFGKVTSSAYYKGFTLLSAPIDGVKREIPGYQERTWQNFDIGY